MKPNYRASNLDRLSKGDRSKWKLFQKICPQKLFLEADLQLQYQSKF